MMRFRCPHCQHILELVTPTETLQCPACEMWCRIPLPAEFELRKANARRTREPRSETPAPPPPPPSMPLYSDPPLAFPPADSGIPYDASRDRPPPEPPLDNSEAAVPGEGVEDVELEVVQSGRQRRRQRRRRRAWKRLFSQMDYFVGPTLILLLIFGPSGLFLAILAFRLHPGAGIGAMLMVGGGLWLMLIAAEDGLWTALFVVIVPFYVLYYVFMNFERAAIPFVIQCLGVIIFVVSLLIAGMHAIEERISLVPPPLCHRPSLMSHLK
jgi:hypothetical protein